MDAFWNASISLVLKRCSLTTFLPSFDTDVLCRYLSRWNLYCCCIFCVWKVVELHLQTRGHARAGPLAAFPVSDHQGARLFFSEIHWHVWEENQHLHFNIKQWGGATKAYKYTCLDKVTLSCFIPLDFVRNHTKSHIVSKQPVCNWYKLSETTLILKV